MERQEIIQQWAERVIEIWKEKMYQMKVYDTYQLLESFKHEMYSAANGDVAKVVFAFDYYGKFVDMGVGNGVTVANQKLSTRKRKLWYSSSFLLEVKKLSNIMAAQYANQGALFIVEGLGDTK